MSIWQRNEPLDSFFRLAGGHTRTVDSMSARSSSRMAQHGVTIAIPNGNHELLLPRAIDSGLRAVAHLRENDVPSEVLVIDAGSRDGSPTLLRLLETLYYPQGLRVLPLAESCEIGAARHLALVNARYRYLGLVDANKELIAENLPSFLRALQETEAAAVYGNVLVRTPSSRCAMNLLSNESVQSKLFQGNYIDTLSLVDRNQLLDLGGDDGSCRTMEDDEMWQHLAVNGRKIVFVPLAFGYHYVLPANPATAADKTKETEAENRRSYDPLQARSYLPINSKLLRFHPALGHF